MCIASKNKMETKLEYVWLLVAALGRTSSLLRAYRKLWNIDDSVIPFPPITASAHHLTPPLALPNDRSFASPAALKKFYFLLLIGDDTSVYLIFHCYPDLECQVCRKDYWVIWKACNVVLNTVRDRIFSTMIYLRRFTTLKT